MKCQQGEYKLLQIVQPNHKKMYQYRGLGVLKSHGNGDVSIDSKSTIFARAALANSYNP